MKNINKKFKGKNVLFSIQIEILSKCNLDCSFCYLGTKYKKNNFYLNFENITNIADELLTLGCFEITISGGEDLLHKDFNKISEYLFNKGFKLTLFTNAILINEDIAKDILNWYDFIYVNVPLYDYKKTFFNKKNIENYFYNISLLLPKIQAKMVFNEKSMIYMELFINMCNKFNIPYSISPELIGYNYKRYAMNNKITENYLNNLKRLNLENIKVSCNAGESGLSISANGDVKPCNMIALSFGNIFSNSLSDIWHSIKREKFLKLKRNFENTCAKCKYKTFCVTWCLGDHYNKNNSFEINKNICKIAMNLSK